MHHAVIYINPVGPAPIGFSQAAGMPGDIKVDFKTQRNVPYPNIAAMFPQLVLRPFTSFQTYAYDIVINDPTGASGIATIPGSVMNDRFSVEVYSRDDAGQPQQMLGVGRIDLHGYAYQTSSPLGPATYSTGPSGPAGPQGSTGAPGPTGQPGQRGSRWYTGAGVPSGIVPDDRVDGDMYLDTTNGDVWRWSATTATWMPFKGA